MIKREDLIELREERDLSIKRRNDGKSLKDRAIVKLEYWERTLIGCTGS